MNAEECWNPLVLPEKIMKHGGWLLLKTRLSCEGKRGRTQLRWEDERKTKHTIVLPVARSGNLLEVLFFPPGCNALCWQPSSNNADCNWSEISLKPVSKFESKFRRFRRVWHYYRKFSSVGRRSIGLTGLLWLMDIDKAYKLCGELRDDSPQEDYQNWLSQHDKLLAGDKKLISKKINRWNYIPKFRFHIVGQGDDRQFKTTVDSIEKICFPAEYIAIVCPGDFTDNPDVRNGNASSDEWQWVIPAGSIVSESSLYRIAHIINAYPGKQFIYGDHDLLDKEQVRHSPMFKPDWSPTLLLTQNYIGWSGLWRYNGGCVPSTYDTLHELWLRLGNSLPEHEIAHLDSLILQMPETVVGTCSVTHIASHLSSVSPAASVDTVQDGVYRIRWPLPIVLPRVTVIIPTRNGLSHLKACVESLLEITDYPNLEIIIMDNQSDDVATLQYLELLDISKSSRVIQYDFPFNYSAINNHAVRLSTGELICLLNNDTEIIHSDWLKEMVAHLLRPGVGIVGAKLYYSDGTIQHAGDAVGPGGCADHLHSGLSGNAPGYGMRAICAQELSAVTAACMLTRRDVWQEVGGLDEVNLAVAFNDVDYCLRVREAGYRVIWTPHAELYHHESVSRGKDITPEQKKRSSNELKYMKKKWKNSLIHDPFYNQNLNYDRPDFTLRRTIIAVHPWMK